MDGEEPIHGTTAAEAYEETIEAQSRLRLRCAKEEAMK
jgi:hypothetical protein